MSEALLSPLIIILIVLNSSWFILTDIPTVFHRFQYDFRLKDLCYIFVIPALLLYLMVFLISHVLPLPFWKWLANIKLYPRPEWSPILRRMGIILLYLFFFTIVMRW